MLALSPISSQIQYAGALAFDGIDDYVISNPLGAASITETTVSFWLRSDDRNGQGTPFSYATASNADEFLITNYNDFTIYRGPVSVTTGISATDGLWHHLTITWRSSDGQVKLYKDGVASYTGTLTATSIITGGSFVLGQDQGNVGGGFDPTQAFKGSLDQVHVWNVALDEAGVQHDMLDPLRSDEAGLLLNWSFDVAMDYVVGDQTVHHNDGTLYGATWNGSSLGGYTVYATNGVPTENGLDTFTITQPGVQTLEVTATHPLILFDLDVSLEWDAHNDSSYLPQLTADLKRASEYLYDFSNGQVALGHVTVHQNSDEWLSAHVVVKATNRLRPLAAQGGSISTSTVDPQHADIVYSPGQVRMGATWNRYGDTSGASDWALALAHELSHYLLYQEDTYLGVDSQGRLIPIGSCADSAMGDMYDPRNTEFVYDAAHWQADCADTLANRTLGRTEWATNRLWYPWLITPTVTNTGPALMPFNLTTVTILDPISPTNALADPTFFVRYRESAKASSETQAYLLRTDATGQEYVIDAGSVLVGQNRLIARGAQPGDRLCVVDPARRQFGCEVIEASDAELDLKHDATWAPVIQVSPVNSQTIRIAIEGLTSTLTLRARLYPESGYGGEAITLTQAGGLYTGTFRLDFPAMLGHVQVWVDEPYTELNPRREAIVSFAIGGNLGSWPALRGGWPALRGGWPALRGGWPALRGGWPALRGGWPASRGSAAPLASPGGQMLFFTENPAAIPQDNLYTIQSMAALPPLPTGKKAIGQSYSLIASPNVTQVITGSISFQYLTMEVLVEQADEDQLTIHYRDGRTWRALETIRSAYYNLASAASQGPGVYTLLSGVTTPQVTALDPPAAINDVTTTLTISGQDFLPPVDVWLIGSTTTYTLRVLSVSPVSITAVITQGLTAREYQVRVVNRYDAPSAESLPFALYDPAQACFYDFFESGPSKWLRNGAWDIVTLPNGVHAMTDSPNDNYDNAVAPALTATTSITTTDFDLSGCNRPVLSFRHDYVLAKVGASQDVGHVEVSTDHGATWTTLAAYTGGGPYGAQQRVTRTASDEWLDVQWKPVTIDLSAYTGTIRLRFGLTVDRYIADRGWVIDDVRVAAAPPLRKVYLPILRK